jgi:hypothetical protein
MEQLIFFFPVIFMGRKMRPFGIGIKSTAQAVRPASKSRVWKADTMSEITTPHRLPSHAIAQITTRFNPNIYS